MPSGAVRLRLLRPTLINSAVNARYFLGLPHSPHRYRHADFLLDCDDFLGPLFLRPA
jgi:hypothetical protein